MDERPVSSGGQTGATAGVTFSRFFCEPTVQLRDTAAFLEAHFAEEALVLRKPAEFFMADAALRTSEAPEAILHDRLRQPDKPA